MPINSRSKGAKGERELATYLNKHNLPARRGQQFSGTPDSPDVVCAALAELGLHIECKRVENLSIHSAHKKAEEDAGPLARGVVFHRRNGQDWLVTLSADKFLELIACVLKGVGVPRG